MAGQLGLDPPTMLLLPDGPAAEMDQALLNCEAVANCFRCSVSSSAVIITVYCSSVLFSELDEIQNRMNDFLKRTVPNEGFQGTLSPVLLYISENNVDFNCVVSLIEDGFTFYKLLMLCIFVKSTCRGEARAALSRG